jgi:hypothetical protein
MARRISQKESPMHPNPFVTVFDRTNPAHQTVRSWRQHDPTRLWRSTARAYARQYGESRTLLADGRVLRYLWDGARLRQRTYTRVAMAD